MRLAPSAKGAKTPSRVEVAIARGEAAGTMGEIAQAALPGLGPDAADPFRFTWWNTQVGDAVWIEYRGSWRTGVVMSRGRKYVEVAIADAGGRQHRVSRSYSELRRRR